MLRIRWSLLCATAALLCGAISAAAQANPNPLPEEVQAWLEQDQLQRWRALVVEGQTIFNEQSCARCHGEAGTGGSNGPDLADDSWGQSDGSLSGIRETIFWGVRRRDFSSSEWRFEMNPGGGIDLEWNQYAALAAYVWTLSNGTHLPGR